MQEPQNTAMLDNELFRDSFRASPIGIAVETLDGQPVFVNPALCSMLGLTEEEMQKKHCVEFSPPEDAEKDWALFQQLRAHSIDQYQIEKRYFRRDGSLMWGRLSVSLLNGRENPLVLAMVEDITEQKRAQENELATFEMLDLVTKQMAAGVTRCSRDLRYLWVNQTYADWLQLPLNEIVDRPMAEVMGKDVFEALQPLFHRVLAGETVQDEYEQNFRGIGKIWVSATVRPTMDDRGIVNGWVAVLQDITELKRAEEARFRHTAIVESSEDAIISEDLDGRIVSWNEGAHRIFGYTESEVFGLPITILIPQELHEEETRILEKLRAGIQIEHRETVRVTKTGKRVDVSLNVSTIKDSAGRVVGYSRIARDITERKKAERSLLALNQTLSEQTALLQSREELLKIFVKSVPVGAAMFDRDMRYLQVSDRWCSDYGIDSSQVVGHLHGEFFPDIPDRWKEMIRRGLEGETLRADEDTWERESGTIWLRWEIRPWWSLDTKPGGILIFAEDITQRKQAERSLLAMNDALKDQAALLQSREELLKIFVKNAPAGVAMFDREMRYLQVSDRWCSDYGVESSQVLGRSHYELFPDMPPQWRAMHRRGLEGETLRADEDTWDRESGTIWLRWEIRPWWNLDTKPGGILIFAEEITQRKHSERALRESEERMRLAQQTARIGTFEWNIQADTSTCTPELEALYGLAPGTFVPSQAAFEKLVHPDDQARVNELIDEGLRTGKATRGEWRAVWPDGSIHWVAMRCEIFRDECGNPLRVIGVNIDITERKLAEQALAEMTRKLIEAQEKERARIGRELHDDINQRLALLTMEIEQLRENPSEIEPRVEEIRKRISEISTDVQSLAHDLHPSKLEYLGAVAGMKSWSKEFAQRQKLEIDFTADVRSPLPREIGVSLFRVLQEALQNTVKHSGGKRIEVGLREDSEVIHLEVKDTGKGFDVEAASHGNGLGLTSMRERVRLVNGTISIQSKQNGGTAIQVHVPLRVKQRTTG
jgi:PAS domain S-box-containing protein